MSDSAPLLNFSHFLAAHEDGALNHDLTNEMRDLIASLHNRVHEMGGKPSASMTLTIHFKLDSGVIEIKADDVRTKMPKRERTKAIYWATPENYLTRRDPKQRELPLRDVSVPDHASARTA